MTSQVLPTKPDASTTSSTLLQRVSFANLIHLKKNATIDTKDLEDPMNVLARLELELEESPEPVDNIFGTDNELLCVLKCVVHNIMK